MGGVVVTWIILAYRKLVSPFLPRACRFYPSCSAYTEQAIHKYGVLKVIAYGVVRIARCQPWHPGGYDPLK